MKLNELAKAHYHCHKRGIPSLGYASTSCYQSIRILQFVRKVIRMNPSLLFYIKLLVNQR